MKKKLKQSKCLDCNTVLTGTDAKDLALNALAHNHKKHPMAYVKHQMSHSKNKDLYSIVEGATVNRENFRHHLFTRNRFYGVAACSRVKFIHLCNRAAHMARQKKIQIKGWTQLSLNNYHRATIKLENKSFKTHERLTLNQGV